MILQTKVILFDMDGVLIDSALAVERVWRKWALQHGVDPTHAIKQAHGRRSLETIRAIAPYMDAEQENMKVEQMEIEDKEGVTALAGAVELLRELPSDRFAIVTSATRPLAVARLGYAGLAVPKYMVTADDVVNGKPSPEPYIQGAALLGVAPADCLVFEDTPAGVTAAHAAGMRVVALGNTYPAHELQAADARVNSLLNVSTKIHQETIVVELADMHAAKTCLDG
ncbi:MAG TPA: HAD family hydrolase [Candidatus Angelobacter sp.]|nr:HAD family hydrolase [Candidatus Angelobacter sp.]